MHQQDDSNGGADQLHSRDAAVWRDVCRQAAVARLLMMSHPNSLAADVAVQRNLGGSALQSKLLGAPPQPPPLLAAPDEPSAQHSLPAHSHARLCGHGRRVRRLQLEHLGQCRLAARAHEHGEELRCLQAALSDHVCTKLDPCSCCLLPLLEPCMLWQSRGPRCINGDSTKFAAMVAAAYRFRTPP